MTPMLIGKRHPDHVRPAEFIPLIGLFIAILKELISNVMQILSR